MPRKNGIKVCLVTISLGVGGAERSTAILSQMLEMKGYDVHIVILNDLIEYPYSGKIFNLGARKTEDDPLFERISRFKKLRSYFKSEDFDFIIDNRTRPSALKELYYLDFLYRGFNIIYVIRSAHLDLYLPKNRWVASRIVKKAFAIVGVSKYISESINMLFSTKKAISIYNPMMEFLSVDMNFDERYIIFVGRIEDSVKNISLLLEAYQKSKLPLEDIHLKILGNGTDVDFLKQKTTDLGIAETVPFIPFTENVYPYLKNALFTVLTSKYEGFPRILIESLSAATPVVSVDCVSGPNEIITNEENGLLVENFNSQALAEAMDRMVLDGELYRRCKANSIESVSHLSIENIAEEWNKILQNEK